MGQGIIHVREMTELAQLIWFGHSVRTGDQRYIPRPGKLEHRKGRPRQTWVRMDKDNFEGKGN